MASLRDVATEANVSQSTVSKVLNRINDAPIPHATKVRVREAAVRVGYHPSAIARALAGKRMNALGVVMAYDQVSVTSDEYLGPCLDGMLDAGKRHRQKMVLFAEDSWEDALANVPSYCDGHCDGLMLVIPRTESQIIATLEKRSIPFLLVGDSRIGSQLVTVDTDNVSAARAAVTHLIERGHRRIVAFCGNADFSSSIQRLEGYQLALQDAGLPYDPDLVFKGEYFRESGHQNALLLLEQIATMVPSNRPTAVFGLNDKIALGALAAFTERQVRVPQEMSLIGFDDIPEAVVAQPGGLTTVQQDIRSVGRNAVETMLRLIQGEITYGHQQWVDTRIVERGTVARNTDRSPERTPPYKP